jgi:hypothetical protein
MATDQTNPTQGVQGIQPYKTLLPGPQDLGAKSAQDLMTDNALKQMRAYADYMMKGAGQQPVHHWTQGVSNMVNALLGGSMNRLANQRDIATAIYEQQRLNPHEAPGTVAAPPAAGAAPPTAPPAQTSLNDPEGGSSALGFTQTASRSPNTGSGSYAAGNRVKGSYFGNYQGKYNWVDKMDSGKQASGKSVQEAPGIALPSRKTLGQLFDVTTPDGRVFTAKQTDLGPARWTKRGVDVNSALAEQMGYTPDRYRGPGRNPFPTDKHFAVRPHVSGQGDPNLLVQGGEGGEGGAGGADGGLAGRALAFNGDPASLGFAPPIMPQGGGGQPAQAPAQPAGGQDPMIGALAAGRGGGAAGGGAIMPGAAAPAPGLVPQRPQISRDDLIMGHIFNRADPEQRRMQEQMFYQQNMPVAVPGTGGTWYVDPNNRVPPYFVPEIQKRMMDGLEVPYTVQPGAQGPTGRPIPMQGGGGVPAPAQTAPPVDKPFDLIPKKPVGPKGELPDTSPSTVGFGASDEVPAKYAAAGVPSEITGGPKVKVASLGPQNMLTNAPPTAAPSGAPQAPAQQGGQQVAQFGGSPQVPTQQGGQSIESMTPDQYFRWKQQRDIDTKAAEGYQAADTKGFFDKFEGYQTQATQAQNLQNEIQYAQQLAKTYPLRMGPGTPWLTAMDKFLSFFGDENATQRVALSETFTKFTSGTILADMKSKLEGLGQVRLAEIDLLRKAAQAQGNTLGANLAILDLGDRMQRQLQQVGTITRLYKQGVRWNQDGSVRADKAGNPIIDTSKPTQEGMAGAIKMYLSNNPLYRKDEFAQKIAEIKAAPQQAEAPPKSKSGTEPTTPREPTFRDRVQIEHERRQGLGQQGQ